MGSAFCGTVSQPGGAQLRKGVFLGTAGGRSGPGKCSALREKREVRALVLGTARELAEVV